MMNMMNNLYGNIGMKLGVGYRFIPTDKEVVVFLYDKLHGRSENLHGYPLMEYDLYGSEEPWQVWNRFGGNRRKGEDLYFFTKLKKVNSNGCQINRRVGSNGTWSAAYSEDIETRIGCVSVAAHKTHLRYKKQGCPGHGAWIMHEFSLDNYNEYVLCRLRKKNDNKRKISKDNDDDEGRQSKKARIILSDAEKEILLKKYLDSLWNQQEVQVQIQVQVEEQQRDTNSERNHQFKNNEKDKNGMIVIKNNNSTALEYKEKEYQEQVLDQINIRKPSSSDDGNDGTDQEFHETISSWTVSFAEELKQNHQTMVADTNDLNGLLDFCLDDSI
nr:NAC domain-containing protein 12-like [Ziziphus jujuba var. spinosa]